MINAIFTEVCSGATERSTAMTWLGPISLEADSDGTITRLTLDSLPAPTDTSRHEPLIREIADAIGSETELTVRVCPDVSQFRLDVLQALADIPQGALATYSSVARMIGRPAAVRAVASAIGANPLPLVISCHRVVPARCAALGVRVDTIGNYTPRKELKSAILEREGYFLTAKILFLNQNQ